MKLLDLAGNLVDYVGEPSAFAIGDRVEVKQDGWTGEVVGFNVHSVGDRPEKFFLMPIVKLDHRSSVRATETYYPFSIKKIDVIDAIARLA